MKIYDVTFPIAEQTPIFEGDPRIKIKTEFSLKAGDSSNISQICLSVHTSTHVDAPSHFIKGGKKVADLSLETLIGKCRVIELDESVLAIAPEHIETLENVERVLFKTRNSNFWNDIKKGFRKDFTYIEPETARILVEKGVKLVGIDYLSVDKFDAEIAQTHIILLEKEVIILEGLDFREVPAGDYELICLPLKIASGTGDGAPARTVLREI